MCASLETGNSADGPIPIFSVVIPVKNDEKWIARCLKSLQDLHFPANKYEVILVDNGSTDRTLEITNSFASSFSSFRMVSKPGVYISAVRNAGAAIAKGQIFAFLDSDCEVQPDWLAKALETDLSGINGAFGAYYLIPENSTWVARHWYQDWEAKPAGDVSFLPSGDLFVRREIFEKLSGFNESIQTNEDFELCQRIRAAGFGVTNVLSLGVVHWGTPQTLRAFYRKNRWHGMHVFRVFLRNLPALYNFKTVGLAAYTLLCLIGICLGLILTPWTHNSWIAGAFLLALLTPPLLLAARATASTGRASTFFPMTALFLTYGMARASCLLDWRNWIGKAK